MADIEAAFRRTPWASAKISSQPVGNVTLVRLPTYFQVSWGVEGFEPGEVDRTTLQGVNVWIRPKLVHVVYDYGDGQSSGKTKSLGGVYPDGEVTHTYSQKGLFNVRVTTTFGADFSLDGASWLAIPSTVAVPGPLTQITVREARAVLVPNG